MPPQQTSPIASVDIAIESHDAGARLAHRAAAATTTTAAATLFTWGGARRMLNRMPALAYPTSWCQSAASVARPVFNHAAAAVTTATITATLTDVRHRHRYRAALPRTLFYPVTTATPSPSIVASAPFAAGQARPHTECLVRPQQTACAAPVTAACRQQQRRGALLSGSAALAIATVATNNTTNALDARAHRVASVPEHGPKCQHPRCRGLRSGSTEKTFARAVRCKGAGPRSPRHRSKSATENQARARQTPHRTVPEHSRRG